MRFNNRRYKLSDPDGWFTNMQQSKVFISRHRCKLKFFNVYGRYGEDVLPFELVEFQQQPNMFRPLRFGRKYR